MWIESGSSADTPYEACVTGIAVQCPFFDSSHVPHGKPSMFHYQCIKTPRKPGNSENDDLTTYMYIYHDTHSVLQ